MNSININKTIEYLKSLILNKKLLFNERIKNIESLIRIPHKNIDKVLTECIISILTTENIDINIRYNFIKSLKINISKDVLKTIYLFYFNNFNYPKYPFLYKFEICKYLLYNIQDIDNRELINFLDKSSKDKSVENFNNECKNILKDLENKGIVKYDLNKLRNIELNNQFNERKDNILNIRNLSDEKKNLILKRRIVYEDTQNVHNSNINNSIKNDINNLYKEYENDFKNKRLFYLNELSMRITYLIFNPISKQSTKNLKNSHNETLLNTLNNKDIKYFYNDDYEDDNLQINNKYKVQGSFDRILTDTSLFENNLTLIDIFILVWIKIRNSKYKEELEKRMIEELIDMNGLCVTGHLSRILNILYGFYEMNNRISYREQLKSYIFNHYNKLLMNSNNSEELLEEILSDKKDNLLKFVKDNNILKELKKEFKHLIKEKEIEKLNLEYMNLYCGVII